MVAWPVMSDEPPLLIKPRKDRQTRCLPPTHPADPGCSFVGQGIDEWSRVDVGEAIEPRKTAKCDKTAEQLCFVPMTNLALYYTFAVQERAYVTGLTAANHLMESFPGDGGRQSPILQTEPDEPQVRAGVYHRNVDTSSHHSCSLPRNADEGRRSDNILLG